MAAVLIRNIPEETHRAIKIRAKQKGTSAEAEIRAILEEAVCPKERMKVGAEIRKLVGKYGGVDLEIDRDINASAFSGFQWSGI